MKISSQKIYVCAFREYDVKKGKTGGPGGVLAMQKEILGEEYKSCPVKYMFLPSQITYPADLSEKANSVASKLRSVIYGAYFIQSHPEIKKDIENGITPVLMCHEIGTAYGAFLLGLKYCVVYHQQGSILNELIASGCTPKAHEIELMNMIEKRVMENAVKVYFPSMGAKQVFMNTSENAASAEKISYSDFALYNTIPNVEEDYGIELVKKLGVPEIDKETTEIFFSCGDFNYDKGMERVPEFLNEYAKRSKKKAIWIAIGEAGEFGVFEKLEKGKKAWSFDSYLFGKRTEHTTLLSLMAYCDYYIMLHRNSIFDLATLEAMREGVPLILSPTGGNLEFNVEDNVVFAEEGNYAAAVNEILKREYNQWSQSTKRVFNTYFSHECFGVNYMKALDDLLDEEPRYEKEENVSLVVEKTTVDYVVDAISKQNKINVKCIYFIDESKEIVGHADIPVLHLSDFKLKDVKSIVVAVNDIKEIKNTLNAIISDNAPVDEKEIFILRPSCLREKANFFFIGSDFDPNKVLSLPFSSDAFDIINKKLHSVISPKEIAKKVYTTQDNINAYEIENLYLSVSNIGSPVGFLGYLYDAEGTVLNSCINGRLHLQYCLEDMNISNNKNVVNIDYACALARIWSDNYFHCVAEIVDKIIIAEEFGFNGVYILRYTADLKKMISLMGIPLERIIWVDKQDIGKAFHINSVFDVEGIKMHDGKTISRVCEYSEKIIDNIVDPALPKEYPKMLYVQRIGRRKLLGVEGVLKKFDFFTFIPEEHTLQEEILYFHNADIVLCPHGAASVNALFMRKGAALVETCPCNWTGSTVLTFIIVKAKSLIYRQMVESTNVTPKGTTGQFRDYRINNNILEYTLNELVGNEIQNEKNANKVKLVEIQNQLKQKETDLFNIQKSLSFRIGRIITFIPRKLRDWFKKKR